MRGRYSHGPPVEELFCADREVVELLRGLDQTRAVALELMVVGGDREVERGVCSEAGLREVILLEVVVQRRGMHGDAGGQVEERVGVAHGGGDGT